MATLERSASALDEDAQAAVLDRAARARFVPMKRLPDDVLRRGGDGSSDEALSDFRR